LVAAASLTSAVVTLAAVRKLTFNQAAETVHGVYAKILGEKSTKTSLDIWEQLSEG
jgi:hypothetical protein